MTERYDTMYRAIDGERLIQDGLMYYAAFTIDTSLLDPEHVIHFDLYNAKLGSGEDYDITMFALLA
ncbi:MAG: hypothetical protein HS130_02350 [Deltaproteobacteria bacterium]|nr:hypothetical protein [Deltaproteobacteria bacterium]